MNTDILAGLKQKAASRQIQAATSIDIALLQHLEGTAAHYRGNTKWPVAAALEELLLAYGQFFRPITLPTKYQRGKKKMCFFNGQILALEQPGLCYVEGVALEPKYRHPIHHGWCITPDGRAVDPTWGKPGLAYCGVPFKATFLREWFTENLKKKEACAFLDLPLFSLPVEVWLAVLTLEETTRDTRASSKRGEGTPRCSPPHLLTRTTEHAEGRRNATQAE